MSSRSACSCPRTGPPPCSSSPATASESVGQILRELIDRGLIDDLIGRPLTGRPPPIAVHLFRSALPSRGRAAATIERPARRPIDGRGCAPTRCRSDADGLDVLPAGRSPAGSGRRSAQPTPPQRLGWPAIAAGRNTLIFAPTGSGKTLAAFLACLDHLWRNPDGGRGRPHPLHLAAEGPEPGHLPEPPGPARRDPRDGRGAGARPCRRSTVAVRSGDTPAADRQRMVRKPPDILITTPESLHLMLTSRARETLGRSRT